VIYILPYLIRVNFGANSKCSFKELSTVRQKRQLKCNGACLPVTCFLMVFRCCVVAFYIQQTQTGCGSCDWLLRLHFFQLSRV
jgi:hypothetical protein